MYGPRRRNAFLSKVATSVFCAVVMTGCGDGAVPDPVVMDAPPAPVADAMSDAMLVDACACESTGDLIARITHVPLQREIFDDVGVGSGCGPYPTLMYVGELLGGSCVLESGPSEDDAAMTELGVYYPDIQKIEEQGISWFGFIRAFARDEDNQMIVTAACIDTAVDATAACSRQLDVSHEVEYAWIPPGGVIDAGARCASGTLVGGGCSVAPLQEDKIRILRAGMDPADPNRWLCSWRSHDAAEDIAVAVQAFCLEETIPESCACCPPLTDSIRVQQETQPLTPGTNRLQATCDPGELLLLGNCMLDGADSATLANVTMFRFGIPPGDTDTWGCSWNNPDAIPATAIATALCLPGPGQ
jgi:hypothetical protein